MSARMNAKVERKQSKSLLDNTGKENEAPLWSLNETPKTSEELFDGLFDRSRPQNDIIEISDDETI